MARPSISIICPVYNAERYVEACVRSCLAQTLRNIELIFVDDGSRDGSRQVLEQLAAADARLRVVPQENGGASSARNHGLDEAAGEFAFFLDADDYIPEETALERLYAAAMANGVPVAGGSMCIDRGGKVDFDSLHGRELDSFFAEGVVSYADYQYDYDFTRYIYSLDMLREHGIRFPDLVQFEDPVFFVRAMLAAERFATIPDAVYAYRYAHKEMRWSEKMVLDRLEGIETLIDIAREQRMPRLYAHLVQQLDEEMVGVFLENSCSAVVLEALARAQGLIDTAFLRRADPEVEGPYVLEALRRMGAAFSMYGRLRRSVPGRIAVRLKHMLLG